MTTRQERLNALLLEMNRLDTVPLIIQELPALIDIVKQDHTQERVTVLEHVLRERGAIPQPPERPSERAMRLSQKSRLDVRIDNRSGS